MTRRIVPAARSILILGPRRCGKSEAAEQALASVPHLLYVATLWHDSGSAETIARHRLRRGDRWQLLELEGRLEADAQALASSVAALGRPAAVLVDGLTTWAIRVAGTRARLLESARETAAVLVFCAREFPDVTWCWIDAIEEPDTLDERLVVESSRTIWRALQSGVPGLLNETWTSEGRTDANSPWNLG